MTVIVYQTNPILQVILLMINVEEDVSLFSINYSDDGLDLHLCIDTTGFSEIPNQCLRCKGVIISRIQNASINKDDGLPIYVGIVEVRSLENEEVPLLLKELGFGFSSKKGFNFGKCFGVRIESGDFILEVVCKKTDMVKLSTNGGKNSHLKK